MAHEVARPVAKITVSVAIIERPIQMKSSLLH